MALVEPVQARRLVEALLDVVEENYDEDNDGRKVGHNPPEHLGESRQGQLLWETKTNSAVCKLSSSGSILVHNLVTTRSDR